MGMGWSESDERLSGTTETHGGAAVPVRRTAAGGSSGEKSVEEHVNSRLPS